MGDVFFGVDVYEKFYLPGTDKQQWIEVRKLNAGQKALYSNSLGEMSQSNPDGTITVNTARAGELDKKILELAVAGYKVKMKSADGSTKVVEGTDVAEWNSLYEIMDANLIDGLMEVVRKVNPWLNIGVEDKKKLKS